MKIIITYKNGNTIEHPINWMDVSEGKLFFSEKKNPHPVSVPSFGIPLANIATLRVEEGE